MIMRFVALLLFLHSSLFLEAYWQKEPTKLEKYLQPLYAPITPSGLNGVDCIYVINLQERPERWKRTENAFLAQGLVANRVNAVNGWKIPQWKKTILFGPYNVNLDGGAIGCLLSHVSIYKDAYQRGFKIVWICEDDIEFIKDITHVDALLQEVSSIDPEWDILYTDHTLHGMDAQSLRPNQAPYISKHEVLSPTLVHIHGRHCAHSILFSRKGLKKILDYFTHVYLYSALDVDIHMVPGLREYSASTDLVTSIKKGSYSDTERTSSLNK